MRRAKEGLVARGEPNVLGVNVLGVNVLGVNVLGVVLKARPDTAPRKALKDEYTTPHQGRLGRARRANRCVDRAGRAPSRGV